VALTKCLRMAKGFLTLGIRWQHDTTSPSKSEDDTVTICSRRVDTDDEYLRYCVVCRSVVNKSPQMYDQRHRMRSFARRTVLC
jgi:hypothetical protein